MIKKYIVIIGCFCVIIFVIIVFARLYPVAMVNGSPIWYRTWDRYIEGNIHALVVQAQFAGTEFSPDARMISAIRKNALQTLIEDNILTQAGSVLVQKFDVISNQRIDNALAVSADIGKAAFFMYGFTAADFHDFVLLPQSHREVIIEEFDKKKINFEAWFAGIKKKAHIRLMLHSYTWDGDTIR
ncbi:MAG: hypothetical protein AAB968_00095 [Patescibacteria group bacterium]